jgi:hypothetical protein
MKIDKQLPNVNSVDTQLRRQTQAPASPSRREQHEARGAETHVTPRVERQEQAASFSLQLNQQLSSMQSADNYLADLAGRLGLLKLSLSRQLSTSTPTMDDGELHDRLQQARSMLAQRGQRSGQALDARMKLHLHEPVRAHFSMEGLETIDKVRQAGSEILLFTAGRKLAEPLAVVLDEGLSEQQVLRRFNASLGQAGLRVELEATGTLKFSAAENHWAELKGALAVQGSGGLFEKGAFIRVNTQEEELLRLPSELRHDDVRELRRTLDAVVQTLDRISLLREHIAGRQQDIREFLARHAGQNEKQWASGFVDHLYRLLHDKGADYRVVSQTVVAQSNLNRFTVVSLLS